MSKVAPLELRLPLEVSTEHCGSLFQSNISFFNPMFDSSVIYVTFGAPIDTPRFARSGRYMDCGASPNAHVNSRFTTLTAQCDLTARHQLLSCYPRRGSRAAHEGYPVATSRFYCSSEALSHRRASHGASAGDFARYRATPCIGNRHVHRRRAERAEGREPVPRAPRACSPA